MSDQEFPTLPEEAQKDAERFIEGFKAKLTKIVDEVLSDAYVDVLPWIEVDGFQNFRGHIVKMMSNYRTKERYGYDFKRIRQAILEEHRDELIADLNQDLLEEIKKKNELIEYLQRGRS